MYSSWRYWMRSLSPLLFMTLTGCMWPSVIGPQTATHHTFSHLIFGKRAILGHGGRLPVLVLQCLFVYANIPTEWLTTWIYSCLVCQTNEDHIHKVFFLLLPWFRINSSSSIQHLVCLLRQNMLSINLHSARRVRFILFWISIEVVFALCVSTTPVIDSSKWVVIIRIEMVFSSARNSF